MIFLKSAEAKLLLTGRIEGRIEGINLVIRQMIAKGMAVQQVADIVNMSVEEIEAIIAE